MNVRRRGGIEKWLRDYLVPIIWLLLIIILIFNVFFSDSSNNTDKANQVENKVGLSLLLDWVNSESFIVYPGGNKEKITWDTVLYKWEKVIVKEGMVNLSLAWLWDFKVNKLWELKYKENGNFAIYSWDIWLNANSSSIVNMRFASVKVWENTHISFSQNEMWSTIYLISWFAEVSNLAWKSTVLANGQKITVSRIDANKKDVDLSLLKESIDDYYKQSDWFILNNWSSYLVDENSKEEKKTETSTWKVSNISQNNIITFSNLYDESNVSSDNIIVSWNYKDENISKILLNWKEAEINKELKTFKFKNVLVENKENDLVFKVYDDANDLLSKFVYVVYYDWAKVKNTGNNKFNVKTYKVDWRQFIFTSIRDGVIKTLDWKTTHTTYWDFLTIYWKVKAKWISRVEVDWYTLKSFNWSTWRYHSSSLNNNLNIGTNIYNVKYYDKNDKLVYTNNFTIIKKSNKPEWKEIFSDEVKIN